MYREFFGRKETRTWAWLGLVLVVGHGVLGAVIKARINDWFSRFYDLAGAAGSEAGSGSRRREILGALVEFSLLCLPSVALHPLFRYLTNRWVLSWRLALIDSYLREWKPVVHRIENANQRIAEDTQRFARGVLAIAVLLLDCVLTLVVFVPILVSLGAKVQPRKLPDGWLVGLCAAVAFGGLGASLLLGWSLVDLEVRNQAVEADLRRELVLAEEKPHRASGPDADTSVAATGRWMVTLFSSSLAALKDNYKRLYARLGLFSVWLGAYEQAITILPYCLAAPMLFSEHRPISLGTLTQLSHAFGSVFNSLNVVSDRWVELTDFLSVVRRLRAFERMLEDSPHVELVPVGMAPPSEDVVHA